MGGVIAPMMDAVAQSNFISQIQSDPMHAINDLVDQISQHYIGVSTQGSFGGGFQFNPKYLYATYGGLIAGIVGHKLANKFGINRYMKRVPMIGKYVQL